MSDAPNPNVLRVLRAEIQALLVSPHLRLLHPDTEDNLRRASNGLQYDADLAEWNRRRG